MHVGESLRDDKNMENYQFEAFSESHKNIIFNMISGGVDIERHINFKLKNLSGKNAEVNDDSIMIL